MAAHCKFCAWAAVDFKGGEGSHEREFARLKDHIEADHPVQAEQIERFVQDSGDENDYRGEGA